MGKLLDFIRYRKSRAADEERKACEAFAEAIELVAETEAVLPYLPPVAVERLMVSCCLTLERDPSLVLQSVLFPLEKVLQLRQAGVKLRNAVDLYGRELPNEVSLALWNLAASIERLCLFQEATVREGE